ncbi:unnamed protein product [Absidia cylindrospora]
MGYPSEGLEGLYRNHLADVRRFLEKHHGKRYKIFNLRAEKSYDKTKFDGNVSDYPFRDHQVPQLTMIQQLCHDAAGWLDQNSENVVVVHCKAGKGRTGVMIAALLLYTHQAKNAKEAVAIYGKKRTKNGMGVTIPSQIRYIGYYQSILNGARLNHQPLLLEKLILQPVPTKYQGNGGRWVMFCIMDHNNNMLYSQSNDGCHMTRSDQKLIIETNGIGKLSGDFKVQFYYYQFWKKQPLCHFWLNTELENSSSIKLTKPWIDQAYADELCRDFGIDFAIELVFDSTSVSKHSDSA